jgi:hypothetical protein
LDPNLHLDGSSDLRLLLRFLSKPEEGSRDIQRLVNGEPDVLLRRLASAHKIGPLLAHRLEKACPEWYAGENASWLRQEARNNRVIAEILASECVRLVEAFRAAGIDVTTYKGVALSALLFGDVGVRVSRDIDLIVCEGQVAAASSCLRSLRYDQIGFRYEPGRERWFRDTHEIAFQGRAGAGWVQVDLHWRIASPVIAICGDPELLLLHCRTVRLAGGAVPILSLEANLVALCVHGAKHAWQQLRWVCDLGQILTSRGLDAGLAIEFADQMGLRRVLGVGITQVQNLLDVTVPGPLAGSIDRRAVQIAAEMRQDMFTSDEPRGGPVKSQIAWFRLRERWRDRLAMTLVWFMFILRPNLRDYAALPLPDRLAFLYYAIRPLRLGVKYGSRILNRNPG